MSKAFVLVRPGFKTSKTYLEILTQEFAGVGLYTTDVAGLEVIDVTVGMAKPRHLGDLDILVTITSTVDLFDDDECAKREDSIGQALQQAFPDSRPNVGVNITLDIKSGSGEAYKFKSVGEMTMAAAQMRADARIAGNQPVYA